MKYRIVVPSRKRTFLMARLLNTVPTATIVVDEKEHENYAKVVPAEQLVTHPSLPNLPLIRNFMLDHFSEPYLVMMDDDFEAVKCLGGKGRWLRKWDDVRRVLENGVQILEDLGLGIFCWNIYPSCSKDYGSKNPFSLTSTPIGTIVIGGPARHRYFDPQATGRADIDFGLQALLNERIVLCDQRMYMFHGLKEHLPGGASGLINDEIRQKATEYLRAKWGKSVVPPWAPLSKKGMKMRFSVNRRRGASKK